MINDFYDSNAHRAYPLVNYKALPTDTLVGLSVTVPPGVTPYISSVVATGTTVSIEVSVGSQVILAGSSPTSVSGQMYTPVKLASFIEGVGGVMVAGAAVTTGAWQLDSDTGELDTFTINNIPETVYKTLNDLSGIVNLTTTSANVVFEVVNNTVRVYLRDTALTRYLSECDLKYQGTACSRPYIERINGVIPDASGRIFVELRNAE